MPRSEQLTPEQRAMRARIGGLARSAKYDGPAVTDKARATFLAKSYDEVDPERTLTEEERERRAEAARKRYFTELAFKSSKARGKGAGDAA